MSDATIIIIVNIVCATIITVVTLLTRKDVNSLKPEIVDVRSQLKQANEFIIGQGLKITALMDELAMRKPVMTDKQFEEDFHRTPPHTKPKQ